MARQAFASKFRDLSSIPRGPHVDHKDSICQKFTVISTHLP